MRKLFLVALLLLSKLAFAEALPEHLANKDHNDYPWPFSYIPRSWTAFSWGEPKRLVGHGDKTPKPIDPPGHGQISYFPDAPWWALKGLYIAYTTKSGIHFRLGARWDDVDSYTQWPSIAWKKGVKE